MKKPMVKKTQRKPSKEEAMIKIIECNEWCIEELEESVDEMEASANRMRLAIWALVIYDVVFTGLFLLMLYGNQYLVK